MADRVTALPVSDADWRRIIDSAVDFAIISADLGGRVSTWNPAAERILGWSASEMIGQPLDRFFTLQDIAAGVPEADRNEALRSGRAQDERWHLRKGGERFWASGELMPLRDDAGRAIGFVKILRDRTAQREEAAQLERLNATLVASEERLQLALDVGGMGAWQGDVNAQSAVWWPGMDRVHGLPPGSPALLAADYFKLIHPDDRERVARALQEAVRREGGHGLEYRVIWPDGSVHWLESRGKRVPDADGALTLLAGVCLDITHRKTIENDLVFLAAASAELANLGDYRSTLEKVAQLAVPGFADWCAVDILEADGSLNRLALANSNPARIQEALALDRRYPLDPQAPLGPWSVLRSGAGQLVPEITAQLLESIAQDATHLEALRAMDMCAYIGAPLKAYGKTLGVITFVTGQTRRRYGERDLALAQDLARRAAVAIENSRLLEALRESDRAKDVFLATLAHELRNPLAPICNGMSILKRAPQDWQRVGQVAEIIERQVAQLMRLVDDLLDLSRISTGKIELKPVRTSLVQILSGAVETSRPHIESAHHKLTLAFPKESTELEADPLRLAQVFSNLLNNAAKYTPPGGQIEVRVEPHEDQLTVSVRDSGTGIAPDMLQRVFGLFTQVSHPSERRQGGLGIGLSLVKGLVRLHGGRVEARSEGLGRGSEFVVFLPRQPQRLDVKPGMASPVPEESAVLPAASPQTRRVLVVDDNVDAAEMVAELLRIFGNEVAVAHDGSSAVRMTSELRPDVILLDIGLPDINGYEVARRVRKLEKVRQPLLIALTGWGQKQDRQMALLAGFDQHWTKPVDPARLQALSSR